MIRDKASEVINETLAICKEILLRICAKRKQNESLRLKVYSDLLMRIHNNVYAIFTININDKISTAINLIYRSIAIDLYWLLYFTQINDDKIKDVCDALNATHAKFICTHADYMFKLFSELGKTEETDSKLLLLDRLYDKFKDCLTSNKGEPWAVKKTWVSVKNEDVHSFFKDSQNDNHYLLYIMYRYLSQTEHYAPISVSFAFPDKDIQDKLYLIFNAIIHEEFKLLSEILNNEL